MLLMGVMMNRQLIYHFEESERSLCRVSLLILTREQQMRNYATGRRSEDYQLLQNVWSFSCLTTILKLFLFIFNSYFLSNCPEISLNKKRIKYNSSLWWLAEKFHGESLLVSGWYFVAVLYCELWKCFNCSRNKHWNGFKV